MQWISENWSLLVVIAVICVYFIFAGKKSVMKWLLYAVSMAEADLGGGVGKLKLVQVYNDFIARYPILSKILPFAVFSLWVDEVLVEMRKLIEDNVKFKEIIEGGLEL